MRLLWTRASSACGPSGEVIAQSGVGIDAASWIRIRFQQEAIKKLKVMVRPESVGGYSVSVPAMQGCHSQGETREDALENIREAAELWLEVVAETAAAQAIREELGSELIELEL
jgi:predicted RNase H-like HicB family nuclease